MLLVCGATSFLGLARSRLSGLSLAGALLPQSDHPQPVCFAVAFSSKTEYGLVALIELASIYSSGGVLQVAEIALRQGIPDRYLEQMLTSLRRGGILRSIRGPRGGYQLLRPPAEVAVADVVQCLEGDPGSRDGAPETPEYQVLQSLASQLEQARLKLVQSTSLQDLLDRRDGLLQAQTMYFI